MELAGKVALVTGGGTGIGRATALALADQGALVAVNFSKSLADAEETVKLITKTGARAFAIQADVSRESEVEHMVDEVAGRLGRIQLVVNNAGITRHIPFDDLEAVTDAVWDELLAVNVKSMFFVARSAARTMGALGGGAIVNIGSVAGATGLGSSLPYSVSKAAVHGLTRSLARALAPHIRVNCIAPGAVATRWWQGREEQMQKLAPHLLLEVISTPQDIAQAVVWALTQDAMTGQIITIDAGQTL